VTTDPNEVDAWLDEFAPEVDLPLTPRAARPGEPVAPSQAMSIPDDSSGLTPTAAVNADYDRPGYDAGGFHSVDDAAADDLIAGMGDVVSRSADELGVAPDDVPTAVIIEEQALGASAGQITGPSLQPPESSASLPNDPSGFPVAAVPVAAQQPGVTQPIVQQPTEVPLAPNAAVQSVAVQQLSHPVAPVEQAVFSAPASQPTPAGAWAGNDDFSDEQFDQATGGVPAVQDEEEFSAGLESSIPKASSGGGGLGFLLEWLPILIGAAIVAALVRTFVFQAFYIPSGSMTPTLKEQDRVLVNKLSYDFNDVGWGDIVVFKRPENAPGDVPDLIKRVMALPGQRIEVFNGDVYVDNQRVQETYVLQQGKTQRLRGDAIPGCGDATPDACTVPEGYVFVMGDNRNGSTDSRSFGPVPIEDIVGRAVVRVWPLESVSVF